MLLKNAIKYFCTTALQGPQFLSYTDCRATIYIQGPGLAPSSWLLLLLLREKVKKAELKAAGQYLTPAQKAAKVRAHAMLKAMRDQVSFDVLLQSS